jgi:hypothetical protein
VGFISILFLIPAFQWPWKLLLREYDRVKFYNKDSTLVHLLFFTNGNKKYKYIHTYSKISQ